jgi:hypothetical protein
MLNEDPSGVLFHVRGNRAGLAEVSMVTKPYAADRPKQEIV